MNDSNVVPFPGNRLRRITERNQGDVGIEEIAQAKRDLAELYVRVSWILQTAIDGRLPRHRP